MSDEAALLKAITANAGDDTPRLVYADWLDEHDAPIQAEYIRTQCRLASCSAADPDYPDVLERSAELAAQFAFALKLATPPLPPGFKHEGELRRGFLDTAATEWSPNWGDYEVAPPTDEQLELVCSGLGALVATTTVRHLALHAMSTDALARVLAEPAAQALTGLTLNWPEYHTASRDALIPTLGRSKVVKNLERLELLGAATVTDLAALNAGPDRLRALALSPVQGRAEDVPALARAGWFRGLREVRLGGVARELQEPLLVALAGLPRLESLDTNLQSSTALKALGTADGFPELAKLKIESWVATDRLATRLARGRFPRLADLAALNLRNDTLATLLGAKWLPQLRVLDVSSRFLTDKSAVALSRCAAAPHLRILKVAHNRFAKSGLAALGNGTRFPNLTTLDLRAGYTQTRPETLARFAAELSLPRIRHLHLDGWPLGDAGAKALAANPRLAGVTRLSLARCQLTDRGFTALARSPHLQQLLELDLTGNGLKRVAVLLDTDALPRLAKLELSYNPVAPAARAALHRARGWLV